MLFVMLSGSFSKPSHDLDSISPDSFSAKLITCSKKIITIATTNIPDDKDCKNMANRFLKHVDAYFQFITTLGIDPTNNIVEKHYVLLFNVSTCIPRVSAQKSGIEKLA